MDDCVFLQIGMQVKIINDPENFKGSAGKIKTITGNLPNFSDKRAFSLDNESGIWLIEDFEMCVDHPDNLMI